MPRAVATEEQATNLRLVREIEKFPCLYNNKLTEYAKRDVVDSTWEKVAKACNDSAANCKEKWRNLRTVFVRRQKIVAKYANSRKKRKPYYLNDGMQFVVPYLKTKVDVEMTNAISSGHDDYDDDYDDEEEEEETHVSEDDICKIKKNSQKIKQSNGMTMQTDKNINSRKTKEELVKEENGINARKYFLLSLLPDVERFNGYQFCEFRRKVLDAIDYVGRHVTNNNCSSSCNRSCSPNPHIAIPNVIIPIHKQSKPSLQFNCRKICGDFSDIKSEPEISNNSAAH